MGLFKNIFGANAYSNRELKRIDPIKNKVLELDEEYQQLSDAELKGKTAEFKDRLEDGETLDDILPEALATVREAAWRVLEKKPYPVQIIGAIVLHQGRIAEMKTGEGKTLVACVASYLNALSGLGVHVVTVNDYESLYGIMAYPNPTDGQLTLSLNEASCFDYHIYNHLGQCVMNGHVQSDEVRLDLGNLERGIYVISVTWHDNQLIHRVIVQ